MRARKHSRSSEAGGHTRSPEQNVRDAVAGNLRRLRTGVVIPNARPGQVAKSLLQSAPGTFQYYTGKVEMVGLYADGQNTVSIHDQATKSSYGGLWPQPFFELARAALLSAKNSVSSLMGTRSVIILYL